MSADAPSTSAEAPAPTKTGPKTKPQEQFVVFVAFLAGMLILIDPAARKLTGDIVGAVFRPTIGFGHELPALTVTLASLVMVAVTSGVRHYFTDYLKQARSQDVMKAFQKEMRQARKDNNLHKMKKLGEKNKELMQAQAEMSSAQLKPMAITMVVVIPIFAWLLMFMDPGQATPEVVVAPSTEVQAGAWRTTPEELEQLGFPTVAAALGAPGTHFRMATEEEHRRFVEELGRRSTTHLVVGAEAASVEYLVGLPNPECETTARVPWDARWCMDINVQAPIPLVNLFPRWVALYSLFSIPLGQVVGRVLKARDLQGEMARGKAGA